MVLDKKFKKIKKNADLILTNVFAHSDNLKNG